MSKMLDIIMAGIIAGIVALTTSKMGIAGTVFGAVLGAMLFQFMSHFVKDPIKNVKTQRIETKIVYTIPLIIIVVIEIIYLFAAIYWKPQAIFYYLENATDWSLFKSIGLGLIIMGIYPIIQPENIKRSYGYAILFIGVIKLLQGFVSVNSPFVKMYKFIYSEFGIMVSLMVIAVLLYVILSIFQESITISRGRDDNSSNQDVKELK